MTVVCLLDGCALRLCHRPGRASAVLSASPLRSPSCRLSWRPRRGRRFWFCVAGSYANVSAFSTSTRRGSVDLRYHASRLRSVLDSAWKAANGTRAQILSRLRAEETSSTPAAPPPTLVATASEIQEEKVSRVTGTAPPTTHQAPPSAVVATTTEIQEQKECKLTGTAPPTTPQTPPTKQTTPLFHPGSLSVYLGETYDCLSQHVNSYFSSLTKPGPDSRPETPRAEPSFSVRKGLGSHLSYIGNYITPLVPRFRAEPKNTSDEAASDDAERKETVRSEDQSQTEERARRLLLQREKIIARVSVDNRTRALVQALRRASDVQLYIRRVEDLSQHLLEFPETRSVAVQERAIPCLLRLRQAGDVCLQAAVRQALALLGFIEPVRKRGVRILSIDGGGTRKERLKTLDLYFICVDKCAILGFMLGVFQIPLKECEDLYRKLSSDVFKQNVIVGTVKMSWSHAFYDSEIWEKVLKEKMGSDLLIETTRDPHCPKVSAVSTVVNRGPPVKAFVFRNYSLPVGVRSHYRGSCRHRLWEASRASSAAPGYFQEFALGNDLHQDGGMLINNPTALAIHECQCLWPDVPLQCVVSLGTGRFETAGRSSVSYTSLKTKLTNVISSATDTEEVHTMLDALLPPNTYFRFNPYMSEDVALDESREEKLVQMQTEGLQYLERNQEKLQRAVDELNRDKRSVQTLSEWLRLRALTYESFYRI
ncbi:calcium-independent phospholipase A2-gamma-like protein [Labeo rohita]|uniref:Calcium-independent phospholipase A2-gamma-like protein n=1 Tax=Labeo rohita TaxID=84645 RepID=A0A498M8Y4_LABRO|nr:calcium-independent phospholipase A2-gamma-like protein [Labeo rohita]